MYRGPVAALAALEPRIDSDALERELAVRKMERDVEELERLRRLDEPRRRSEAERQRQQFEQPPVPVPPAPAPRRSRRAGLALRHGDGSPADAPARAADRLGDLTVLSPSVRRALSR